jgi:hypothetical protein
MMIRPITDTIRVISGGEFLDEASDQLNELVTAISERGGSGKVTLTISVKKATRGGAMHVTGKTMLTKPADLPHEVLLFATPEGNLVADDPSQMKLDLQQIEPASTVLRSIQS